MNFKLSYIIILFFSFLFHVNGLHAQIKVSGNCIDSVTNKAIPYATITLKNTKIVTDADANGYFELYAALPDTVIITCAGYHEVRKSTSEVTQTGIIYLQPHLIVLPEVIIGKLNSATVGSLKGKKFDMNSEDCSRFEMATRITIPDRIKKYQIKKINIAGFGFNSENPVRIHVYNIGKYGEPDIDLLSKDIVVNMDTSHDKLLSIDVDDQNLLLSERQFYISVQWIADSLNIDRINRKKRSVTGPGIYCTYANTNEVTYSRRKHNKMVGYKWALTLKNISYPFDYPKPQMNNDRLNMLVSCDILYY